MRILHASYWSYPNTGAIDIYLTQIRSYLLRHGSQVDILSRGHNWWELRLLTAQDSLAALDTCTHVYLYELSDPIRSILRSSFAAFAASPYWVREREIEQYVYEMGVQQICNLASYDLIHAHDVHVARAIAHLAPGVPLVVTTHGLLAYEYLVEGKIPDHDAMEWRYTFAREVLGVQSAHVAIAPSNWMREEYCNYFGVPPEKIIVIPYGFVVEQFTSLQKQPPADLANLSPYFTIVCTARLVTLKGHRYLLQALQSLRAAGLCFRCLLVGDGPEEARLRQQVQSMGLSDVVLFLGRRTDVPAILSIADLFVLPSLQEITPLSISEAQLAGKAVIASAIGGVPDMVVHGVSGLLVPPGNADALASAIASLYNDPDRRLRLGRQAQEMVLAERTWDQHVSRLFAAYDTARHRAATNKQVPTVRGWQLG